jgi:hypothetical protein
MRGHAARSRWQHRRDGTSSRPHPVARLQPHQRVRLDARAPVSDVDALR